MKETSKERIQRLKTRRQQLQEQINKLPENIRNRDFKIGRLNDQVSTITRKIKELEKVNA
jgi:uncharacterized protein (DUF3084 family)